MINVSLCWFNFRTRKRGAGLTACSIPGMKLHVESSRQSELHNASKSSWKTFSATSRRRALTSRRQIVIPLPCRDVDFPRRDVILTLLCHVATCTVSSRRQTVKLSVTSRRGILTSRRGILTSRRGILTSRRHFPHVATSFGLALCHVATLPRTSRRRQVQLSVTSRRGPVFSPRMAHFGRSPRASSLAKTLSSLQPILHRTCRRPHSTGRRPLPCSPTTVSLPLWLVLGHSGFFHHCVPDSSLGYSSLGFILVFLCSLEFF